MAKQKKSAIKNKVNNSAKKKPTQLKFGNRILSTKLLVFVAAFALVGGFFLIRSFAASGIVYTAANIDSVNSVGATVIVDNSNTSKKNTKVIRLANSPSSTNSKAVLRNTQTSLDSGIYKTCLHALATSAGVSGKLEITKFANGVAGNSLGQGVYLLGSGSDYTNTVCFSFTNAVSGTTVQAIVTNTIAGGVIQIGNVSFQRTGSVPPSPVSSDYCPLDKVGIPPNCLNIGSKNSSGEFIIKCTPDHTAPDDPIVKPNQPGLSHSHDFYGLRGVTADPSSLIGTNTTCENRGDTAAYWHPTLLVNGSAVKASLLRVYYQGTNQTHTFPPGFQATAGNPKATSPQSDTIAYWGCGSGSSHPKQTTVPQCAGGEALTMHIKMNDCWSGRILPPYTDYTSELGSDGQSKGDGTCPAATPYHIPAVILDVEWPVTPNPSSVSLSCMSADCAHGDFNFGWQPAAFEADMSRCLRNATNCGSVTN